MRLKEFQVKQLCQAVLSSLHAGNWIRPKRTEKEILTKMEGIFLADLRVEDEINREAERLLEQYASRAGENIDREQMFRMIKNQLIKDRKVVI